MGGEREREREREGRRGEGEKAQNSLSAQSSESLNKTEVVGY